MKNSKGYKENPKKPAKPRKKKIVYFILLVPSVIAAVYFLRLLIDVNTPECDDKNKQDLNRASCSPNFQERKNAFLQRYGDIYGYNGTIEQLRRNQLPQLKGQTYVDFTGSGLYQKSQLEGMKNDLETNLYGNTHSINPSAHKSDLVISEMRRKVLSWFNADPNKYTLIFTSGTTGGLKIVGETFPWSKNSEYVYSRANHNSVLGIREYALDKGAKFKCIDMKELDDVFSNEQQQLQRDEQIKKKEQNSQVNYQETQSIQNDIQVEDQKEERITYNLFAYPAECNYSGKKYPLDLINKFHSLNNQIINSEGQFNGNNCIGQDLDGECIKEKENNKSNNNNNNNNSIETTSTLNEKITHKWFVILDAAAFVPTARLDLSKYPADFVCISFYKMFGFPSGIGALIVSTEAAKLLRKTFFGGGTVSLSVADDNFFQWMPELCARFEDGTLAFLNIAGLRHGFDALEKVGGMDQITKGPIINFNVLDKEGSYFGYIDISIFAAQKNIHLRTGCACNPGACYDFLHVPKDLIKGTVAHIQKNACGEKLDIVHGRPIGSIRVSFGYVSNFEDAETIYNFFTQNFRNKTAQQFEDEMQLIEIQNKNEEQKKQYQQRIA